MIKMPTPDEVKEVFFKASLQGWVGEAKKIIIPEFPGYKVIVWEESDWRYLDMYFVVSNTSQSYGTTIVWFKGVPVFIMSYGGWYDKEVIPFLKEALQLNYQQKRFLGGRGPLIHYQSSNSGNTNLLAYFNNPKWMSVDSFDGWEEIAERATGKRKGYHEYWGRFIL